MKGERCRDGCRTSLLIAGGVIIGRHHVGQLFFSAVEELDPTLAVGLGRPKLGTRYKNSRRQDSCLLEATVREKSSENNQISAKSMNVRTAHCFSS